MDRASSGAGQAQRTSAADLPRRPLAGSPGRVTAPGGRLSPQREWHAWQHAARRHVRLLVTADALLCWCVVFLFAAGRYGPRITALLGVIAAAGFVLAVLVLRGYRADRVGCAGAWRTPLRAAGILALFPLLAECVTAVHVPGALALQALAVVVLLACAGRLLHRSIVGRRRARGLLLRRTLLVGRQRGLDHAYDTLAESPGHGLTVVGVCTPHGGGSRGALGDYGAVPRLVEELAIDVVLVAADAMPPSALRRLGWELANQPAALLVLPPLPDVGAHRLSFEASTSTPLLDVTFGSPRPRHWVKEALDRTVGAVLLLAALPVIAVAGALVRLDSRGPAFFSQQRVGIDRRPFAMHKLRSMHIDAEERLAELRARDDGNGMLFKMREDPRITRVGRVLRRFSVDELPQLWNVVKGDMALVGPRPALPSEVAGYDETTAHRLRVKPGLTGLWQVSGRSDLSAERSIRLDLSYVDNWTIGMDLHTMGRTARAVLGGRGAY